MAKIYYIGTKGTRQGPYTEAEAQAWYASGFFSSGVKFQVTVADHPDPNGPYHTLAELIELNGNILPFYFAPEKETRESKQEATLNQLVQDVESLRVTAYDTSRKNEKEVTESIAVLRSQVESLIESQEDLLRQVNALSGQKENSPVAPQLEKRVSELKERVEKQEKNYASMRKELSAVTSKCDRNDTKLERLIEKQQEMEGMVTGYDKRIGDLKASEKSIRDSLSECEQNAVSSTAQLQSINSDLSAIKEDIEKEKTLSTAHESEMCKHRMDLDEVLERIREHSAKLSEVEKSEKVLRNELMATKKSSENTTKVQVAAPSSPFESAVDSVPPWEKEAEKAPVAAAVTKTDVAVEKEKAPWESETNATAEVKKQENRAPWDDDKSQPEPEPWNRTKNDSAGAKKPEEKGPSVEQKVKPAQATVETAAAVKPVSRVKDWNAICRELSDDEEEAPPVRPDPNSLASITQSLEYARNFTNDFLGVLSCYCSALDSGAIQMLSELIYDYDAMLAWQAEAAPKTHVYQFIREQLRDRLNNLAKQNCLCLGCGFMMMTPLMMVLHFTSAPHLSCRLGTFSADFGKMTKLITVVFLRFVIPLEQLQSWTAADEALVRRGVVLHRAQADASRFRPTLAFQKEVAWRLTTTDPTAPPPDTNGLATPLLSLTGRMKDLAGRSRAWLECKKRRRQLQADFDKHLAEGIPWCSACGITFESAAEYFDHAANSYDHVLKDQSIFAMCMWVWKGSDRWDAAM